MSWPLLGVALMQVSFQWVSIVASAIFLVLTVLQLLYLPRRVQLDTTAPRPVKEEWRRCWPIACSWPLPSAWWPALDALQSTYLSLPLGSSTLDG